MSYGLLLLRIVVGATMFGHGAQKLFGWFGGHGPRGTGGFFGSLGFRNPVAMAIIAGLAESSGILLALGFVTPVACLDCGRDAQRDLDRPSAKGLLERQRRV
jgi:putative oxidoreductase